MKKPSPLEQFEEAVFLDANHFSVTRFVGRGTFERLEFARVEFHKALAFARQPVKGRPRALYVISSSGRSVCLEASKDDRWRLLAERVC
jgi:hypothetical protein